MTGCVGGNAITANFHKMSFGSISGRSHGAQYCVPGALTLPGLSFSLLLQPPVPPPSHVGELLLQPHCPAWPPCQSAGGPAVALLGGTVAGAHHQQAQLAWPLWRPVFSSQLAVCPVSPALPVGIVSNVALSKNNILLFSKQMAVPVVPPLNLQDVPELPDSDDPPPVVPPPSPTWVLPRRDRGLGVHIPLPPWPSQEARLWGHPRGRDPRRGPRPAGSVSKLRCWTCSATKLPG